MLLARSRAGEALVLGLLTIGPRCSSTGSTLTGRGRKGSGPGAHMNGSVSELMRCGESVVRVCERRPKCALDGGDIRSLGGSLDAPGTRGKSRLGRCPGRALVIAARTRLERLTTWPTEGILRSTNCRCALGDSSWTLFSAEASDLQRGSEPICESRLATSLLGFVLLDDNLEGALVKLEIDQRLPRLLTAGAGGSPARVLGADRLGKAEGSRLCGAYAMVPELPSTSTSIEDLRESACGGDAGTSLSIDLRKITGLHSVTPVSSVMRSLTRCGWLRRLGR